MTRTPKNPAAERAPVARRAARAPVPGRPATSPAPHEVAGGKTSHQAVSPDSLPGGRPGPETRRPGPAAVRAGDQTSPAAVNRRPGEAAAGDSSPAGRAPDPRGNGRVPAGSRGYSGEEFRKRLKAAQSKRQPRQRTAAKVPAIPPPSSGTSLEATARCLSGCEWTAGPGDPDAVNRLAAAHTEKPPLHATSLASVPVAARTARTGGS